MICTELSSNNNSSQYIAIQIALWSAFYLSFLATLWSAFFILFLILRFSIYKVQRFPKILRHMKKSAKKLKNYILPLTLTPFTIALKQAPNIVFKIFKINYILVLTVISIGFNIISIEMNFPTVSNPIITILLILGLSIYVLLFNKEILEILKMCFRVTRRPCILLHHLICPAIIFLPGLNSLLFLIMEHHQFVYLPFILTIILILMIRTKSNICFNPSKSSSMGFLKILLTILIYYFTIKNFYDLNLVNIYKLLYRKFYISNLTMTGITSAAYLPPNPRFCTLNFSINSYIVEGNSFFQINFQTNSWVLTPFIIFVGSLFFSLLMFLNYNIYCKKVKKNPKEFWKNKKIRIC